MKATIELHYCWKNEYGRFSREKTRRFISIETRDRFIRNLKTYGYSNYRGETLHIVTADDYPLTRVYREKQKMTAITIVDITEGALLPYVKEMGVGEPFKTKDGKILMRVNVSYRAEEIWMLNLQTGACWIPGDDILNSSVYPLDATLTIKRKK